MELAEVEEEGPGLSSFELNKIAGAILGSLLLAVTLNVISYGIFAPGKLAKPGYDLPAATEPPPGKSEAVAVQPIAERLVKADPTKGEADTKPCQSCHSFEQGGAAKMGPPLYGVVGRPVGSVAGFAYSDSLKAKGGDWSFENLDHFLTNPKAYVSGTKMTYAGERDPDKRADIIDYLRTLSDHPQPLSDHPEPSSEHPEPSSDHPEPSSDHPEPSSDHPQPPSEHPEPLPQN